jgi:hypothetical protein
MNKFIINEEEKKRILMMHQSATKKQYLNESTADSVFDDLIGKTVLFKPKGIKSIIRYDKDGKILGEFGSDILNIEGLMDDKSHEILEKIAQETVYGKIVEVAAGADGVGSSDKFRVDITFRSDMEELNQMGTDDYYMFYYCNTGMFEFDVDYFSNYNPDLGWVSGTYISVGYTCVKLSDILDANMPCSEEAFDLSLNQEKIPNTLA